MKIAVHFPSREEPLEMSPDDLETLAAEEGQAIVQFAQGRYRMLSSGSMRVLLAHLAATRPTG